MPDPITKVTWDNPAYFSKKDADELKVETGDMVTLALPGGSLDIAVYVLPGQPIGVIGLPLGYGRKLENLKIGVNVGFNTYATRTASGFFTASGVKVAATGDSYKLAMTQNHYLIDALGFNEREERIGGKFESGKLIHETTLEALQIRRGSVPSQRRWKHEPQAAFCSADASSTIRMPGAWPST